MRKVYNTQKDMASGFEKFLIEVFPNIRKTQLKIIPYILHASFPPLLFFLLINL